MKIIDLIEKLQTLYNTYDDEYKSVAGEPEIMIDVFESIVDVFGNRSHTFGYSGFGKDIVISKSDDGVYDILSAFYEDQTTETPELSSSFMSKP